MGYSADLRDSRFHIDAGRKDEALAAIKALFAPEVVARRGYQGKYSWVEADEVLNSRTLEEALGEWGWPVRTDEAGNIVGISFETGDNKLGAEDVLFAAIAPFVRSGSYLAMVGEDGDHWRWRFIGGSCRRQNATISYED